MVLVNGCGGIGKSTICRKIFHELDAENKRTLAWVTYNDENLLDDIRKQFLFPKEGREWEKRFIIFLQQTIEKEAESIKLIYNYYRLEYNGQKIQDIVKRAGYHTLVIEILGKIANAEGYSLDILLYELEENGFDLEGIAYVGDAEDTLVGHLCKKIK